MKCVFSNHKSAVDNKGFVCDTIEQLLLAGSAVEVKRDQVHVCSPLGVVPKKNGKISWKYLAFSLTFDGKPRYFLLCSLPFGLSASPYVFTSGGR